MKTDSPLTVLLAIVLVLVGVYLGFSLIGSTAVSTLIDSSDQSPTASENQPSPTAGEDGSESISCDELAATYIGFELETDKTLPSRFPQPPGQTTYCGAVTRTRSYYYLFTDEDKVLLDFYSRAFEQEQCSITGIQEAPGDRSYTYVLPYTCTFGRGIVATFDEIGAFVVTLE